MSQWHDTFSFKWWMALNSVTETKSVIATWSLKTCFWIKITIWKSLILDSLATYLETWEMAFFPQGVVPFHTWLRRSIFRKSTPANPSIFLQLALSCLSWLLNINHFLKLPKTTTFTSASLKTDQTFSGRPWYRDMVTRMLLVLSSRTSSIACCRLIPFTGHRYTS